MDHFPFSCLNSAAFNITGLSCVPSRLSSLSSSDIDSAQDIMVEQSHLRVDPGFGQYYFYQLDNAEYLITSPNTSYLPTPPPSNYKPYRHDYVNVWRYPRYIPDDMPHLAFLSRHAVFDGPIFGRLNVTPADVPIVRTQNGKYMLRVDVVQSWQRLETALFGVQQLLLQPEITNGYANLRIGIGNMPYECGYQHPHKADDIARRCALKSRDAFLLLGALCSFAISFYRSGHLAKDIVPLWHRRLLPRSYTIEWLELLEGTFVCDFSRGARVGGYIQANDTGLFPQIRALLDANVPLWFEWHIPDMAVPNSRHGSPFFPHKNLIQHAMDRAYTNTHDPIYATEPIKEWMITKPSFYQGGADPYDEPFDNESAGKAGMMKGNREDSDEESDYGKLDEDEDMDSVLEHPPSSRATSQLRPSPSPTRPSLPAGRPSPPSPRPILPAPGPPPPAMLPQSATNIPMVHAGSGQRTGETHTEFFDRRLTERTAAVRKESQVEFSRRRDLEAKAANGP